MSSTNVGSIHYDLSLDTDKFDKASSTISSKLNSIGDRMTSMGKTMTAAVTVPIVAGFGLAIKAASDLNETLNKVDVAFKDQSDTVKQWSKTSLTSMGLAQASALDAAALFGDMSTAMGLNTKEAADMSMGLTQLGADLASFKNISFERAQIALAGVYTGETEALKGLGIVMTEANLEAFAMSRGIKKNIQDMTQAEKVQLRYNYVMSVTKNAQGDFARTADGTANQIRIVGERFKELSAEIGQRFLPIANQILGKLSQLMERFNTLSPAMQNNILKFVGFSAVIGPLLIVIGSLITAITAIAAVISGPVALAIIGLIALVVALRQHFGSWSETINAVKTSLQQMYDTIAPILLPSLTALYNIIAQELTPALMRLWNTISPVLIPTLQVLGAIFGGILVAQTWATINVLRVAITVASTLASFFANLIQWTYNVVGAFGSLSGAIYSSVGNVLHWLMGIRNMIMGAIGDLRWVLWNAGSALIQGLWDGMVSKWQAVSGWLKSRANDIKNLKGPIDKDKVMLLDEGKAVMDGFNNGLLAGYNNVRGTLTGITSELANGSAINNGGMSSSQSTNFYQPVNIYGNSDAQQILRMISQNQSLALQGVATPR